MATTAMFRTLLVFALTAAGRSLRRNRLMVARPGLTDESAQHQILNKSALVETNGTVAKPKFNISAANTFMNLFARVPPQACGEPLFTHLKVSSDMTSMPQRFFAKGKVDGVRAMFAAVADWGSYNSEPFPVMSGHRIVRVNDKELLLTSSRRTLFGRSLKVGDILTFEVGSDFRKCWGNLVDSEDEDVCGEGAMDRLKASMVDSEVAYDEVGMSVSSIVKNTKGFIWKSLDSPEQYELLKQVMPTFDDDMKAAQRRSGRCFNTALAPICFAVALPQDGSTRSPMWMAMRKVELANANSATLKFEDDDAVKFFDLKGPRFVGWRDLKSALGSSHVWHRKDAGFHKQFPHGVDLHECGSREASWVLSLDSKLLMRHNFTDYSLLAQLYEEPQTEPRCECEDGRPRFPLVIYAKERYANGAEKYLKLAVGIIDYLEQGVANFIKMPFSTMKKPSSFQSAWMRMWPMYFRMPARRLAVAADEVGVARMAEVFPGTPGEEVRVGDTVWALQKIKWEATSETFNYKRLYTTQTEQSFSKRKVQAGSAGRVVAFHGVEPWMKLIVEFESRREELFLVEPSQVMTLPRRVLSGGNKVLSAQDMLPAWLTDW